MQIYYYLIINILLGFISTECEFLAKFESEIYQSLKKVRKTVFQSKKNKDENQDDMKIEQKNEEEEENEKRNEKKRKSEEEEENEKRSWKQDVDKISFNELLLLNIEETNHLLTE